jgi:hypothetical protein
VNLPISTARVEKNAFFCFYLRNATVYPQTSIDREAFTYRTNVTVLSDMPKKRDEGKDGDGLLGRLRKLFRAL